MAASDDFKQAIKTGNISEAIKTALGKVIELEITTWVANADTSGADTETNAQSQPGTRMRTRINLIDGDIDNEVGSQFLTNGPYAELREFHLNQVREGQQIIHNNIKSLQQLFSLWMDVLQQSSSQVSRSTIDLADVQSPLLPSQRESVTSPVQPSEDLSPELFSSPAIESELFPSEPEPMEFAGAADLLGANAEVPTEEPAFSATPDFTSVLNDEQMLSAWDVDAPTEPTVDFPEAVSTEGMSIEDLSQEQFLTDLGLEQTASEPSFVSDLEPLPEAVSADWQEVEATEPPVEEPLSFGIPELAPTPDLNSNDLLSALDTSSPEEAHPILDIPTPDPLTHDQLLGALDFEQAPPIDAFEDNPPADEVTVAPDSLEAIDAEIFAAEEPPVGEMPEEWATEPNLSTDLSMEEAFDFDLTPPDALPDDVLAEEPDPETFDASMATFDVDMISPEEPFPSPFDVEALASREAPLPLEEPEAIPSEAVDASMTDFDMDLLNLDEPSTDLESWEVLETPSLEEELGSLDAFGDEAFSEGASITTDPAATAPEADFDPLTAFDAEIFDLEDESTTVDAIAISTEEELNGLDLFEDSLLTPEAPSTPAEEETSDFVSLDESDPLAALFADSSDSLPALEDLTSTSDEASEFDSLAALFSEEATDLSDDPFGAIADTPPETTLEPFESGDPFAELSFDAPEPPSSEPRPGTPPPPPSQKPNR